MCAGDACILSASGATNYTWMPGGANTASVTVTPSASTVYSVTGTTGTCIATPVTVTVTVYPAPVVTASVSPYPVCAGQTINLSCYASGSGLTYLWAGPGSYATTMENPIRPNANMSMNGTYSVTVSEMFCSATATVAVVVNPSPAVSYTLVADAAPHTWDAYPSYSSNSVDSARWYWGDGTSTLGLYPSHTYSVAGTYSICVIVTYTYSSCPATSCQNDAVSRSGNNSPYSNMVYINVLNSAAGIQTHNQTGVNIFSYGNAIITNGTIPQGQQLKVFNTLGQVVLTTALQNNIETNLPSGIYTIQVIDNTGSIIEIKKCALITQ
ncbi:MAG TPA: PKD domain-containing protein [Bacteroidia bacterium]